jgi:uncharacterized protein
MIFDFRMVPAREEYMTKAARDETARMLKEGFLQGYSRVYQGDLEYKEEWRSTTEGMIKSMDEAGVDAAVMQAEYGGLQEDHHALNKAVLRLNKEHPDKFPVMFMCVNPHADEDMVKLVEWGYKKGFRGLNYEAWSVNVPADDSRLWPVYAKLQELGMILTFHCAISFNVNRPIYMSHPYFVDKVACDFPKLNIIANHGGWPWVNELVAIAWKHRNVYIEIGAISPKYIGTPGTGWDTLMRYGNTLLQDQVLFATDCMLPHKRVVEELRALPLKKEVKEKWLGKNAAALLGLK